MVNQLGDRIRINKLSAQPHLWLALARKGIGTIIGRRSVSKGRQYTRIWIYVPTKVSEDTAFPFKIGDPCIVEIDVRRKQLTAKRIGVDDAIKFGWRAERRRVQEKAKSD